MNKPLVIKIGIIAFITLIFLIVLQMVSGTVWERKRFQIQAKNSVAKSWTGHQEVFGPILVLPYKITWQTQVWSKDGERKVAKQHSRTGQKWVMASALDQSTDVETEVRYQGIYKFPVYSSKIQIDGHFSTAGIKDIDTSYISGTDIRVEFDQPFIGIGIADARGINSVPKLDWVGETIDFSPGSRLGYMPSGLHTTVPKSFLVDGAKQTDLPFSVVISLRGMDQIIFYPVAKNYSLHVSSPWQHPKFIGNFLPLNRTISDAGFDAQWAVTSFATNMEDALQRCEAADCKLNNGDGFGINFIEPVDIYLQSERSLKYGLLFIILVFTAFFVFEILKKLPIHPIQYSLVGLAIAVFYLLLMSLSEHLNFSISYSLAALACVVLISFYLIFVLRNTRTACLFGGLLGLLYAMLYVIVSAEDFALLMGSGLVFAMLTLLMVTTRRIDWYQVGLPSPSVVSKVSSNPTAEADDSHAKEIQATD